MAVLIKNICNRTLIEFDKGAFDEWCIYLTRPNHKRYAPKDAEYFSWLQQKSHIYGAARIYNDFLKIYERTSKQMDTEVLAFISSIASGYGADAEEADVWFTVIYAGMVAEENKEKARLKKRIKRLGMHQLLLEGKEVAYAAHFSRGKSWNELDAYMKERGF